MSCELLLAADDLIPRQDRRSSEHIHLKAEPTAAREARSFIRNQAPVLDGDQLHNLLVLTSELVTNAVLHARTPLVLGLTVSDSRILVTVGDQAQGQPQTRQHSDRRENGRGMVLVRALADEWGVQPHPERTGKCVWFTMRRVGAGDGRAESTREVGDV
jgi:anti-sigma regulatory factor (Ser/Thr protein kinase)